LLLRTFFVAKRVAAAEAFLPGEGAPPPSEGVPPG
jgi:hypothetical protein